MFSYLTNMSFKQADGTNDSWITGNQLVVLFFKTIFFALFPTVAEPGAGFDSRGLGLKAQKKLLGKMSSKKIAMSFIDETTGRVLDCVHKVLKQYKGNKKEADKVLKYIIKSVVKVNNEHISW